LKSRILGRTGIRISEIGLGTWGMGGAATGWSGSDDTQSIAAIHRALDLGLNFIDTALSYGNGHSERLIGQALRQSGGKTVHIATKIPPKNGFQNARTADTPLREAFPAEHIIAATEESLRNLQREVIDLQQLHVWHDAWLNASESAESPELQELHDLFDAIDRLKSQGKIRAFGISILRNNPNNSLALVRSGLVDAVQVFYNIFDQRPEAELLPLCEQHNVGVLARVPLDEGGLTGSITAETTFPEGDFRNGYFQGDRKREVHERAHAIVQDLRAADPGLTIEDLPRIALQYVLAHPAVTATIPGMRSARNVERNCAASSYLPLTPQCMEILHRHHWDRNWN
jgi:aryl-alcohol dehydrogenase-like predicted oxidoreductase